MTEEQHSIERRQDESRWQWAIGLLVTIALVLLGYGLTAITWGVRMDERMQAVQAAQRQAEQEIGALIERIGSLENTRGEVGVELIGVRRDLAEVKEEIRSLTAAVTQALRNGGYPYDAR